MKSFTPLTFKKSAYFNRLSQEEQEQFEVLTNVFHFKVNEYVLEHLIDWDNLPHDPMYRLAFLQKDMLNEQDYAFVKEVLDHPAKASLLPGVIQNIQQRLKPRIKTLNTSVPTVEDVPVAGTYQANEQTLYLFPSPAVRTCHSYCSYCFRWNVLIDTQAQNEVAYTDPLAPIPFLENHPEISEVLLTGADPLVSNAANLRKYLEPITKVPSVRVINISSKSLAWWPFRFTTDKDADALLQMLEDLIASGKHVNLFAHFTHPRELEHPEVAKAVSRILKTGAQIRCQGPLVRGINDDADLLSEMWNRQTELGMVPYYLFVENAHNVENCFRIPLADTLKIFQEAYQKTTIVGRTIRGPIFMNDLQWVVIDGKAEIGDEAYFVLRCVQSPPGYPQVSETRLMPYNAKTKEMGNLFELFQKEASFIPEEPLQ